MTNSKTEYIAIVTQPLINNYGGIIQNYALQIVLQKLGCKPVTIDYYQRSDYTKWLLANCKSILLLFATLHWRGFFAFPTTRRPRVFDQFVKEHLNFTRRTKKYSAIMLQEMAADGIVVGSDQVWRPRYNEDCLEDMFLRFAKDYPCPKVAYAASFGTDEWEFTKEQTTECTSLASQFTAISVRESSGIGLCKKHLHADAVEMIDPTLLLSAEEYETLLGLKSQNGKRFVAVYCLDLSDGKMQLFQSVAESLQMDLRIMRLNSKHPMSVVQWLETIRNSSLVLTDSFHGTVFSIIFKRPFYSIVNSVRGATRFSSLLTQLGLVDRIVDSSDAHFTPSLSIDFDMADSQIRVKQEIAINFLKDGLNL